MKHFLAIDSGGSKCDALLVKSDGTAIGWGHYNVNQPGSGRSTGGSGRSVETVSRAVQQAVGNLTFDQLQLVSFSGHLPIQITEEWTTKSTKLHAIREPQAVFALAGCNSGVVVLAGTGAFVFGSTEDGRSLWLDGLGPLLGDYGSGYQIGSLAIRAVAKSYWHPRHKTSLVGVVLKACSGLQKDQSNFNLIRYMVEPRDRAEIASLAKLVDAEARSGDSVSVGILKEAATAIAETLRDMVGRLDITDEEYPMIGTGSVIVGSEIYWEHLCGLAREFAPRLKPVLIDEPLAAGMILAVIDQAGIEEPDSFRRNLLQSTKALMEVKNGSHKIP